MVVEPGKSKIDQLERLSVFINGLNIVIIVESRVSEPSCFEAESALATAWAPESIIFLFF